MFMNLKYGLSWEAKTPSSLCCGQKIKASMINDLCLELRSERGNMKGIPERNKILNENHFPFVSSPVTGIASAEVVRLTTKVSGVP